VRLLFLLISVLIVGLLVWFQMDQIKSVFAPSPLSPTQQGIYQELDKTQNQIEKYNQTTENYQTEIEKNLGN